MNTLKFAFFFVLTLVFSTSIQAQDWISYQSQQGINDLIETNNELLMATDAGLVVLDKTTLGTTIFKKANSSLSNNHIQTITQAPNGNTWIGTYDVSLAQFDGNDFQPITVPSGKAFNPGSTELYAFEIAPNGDFWLGTSDGVLHRAGSTWTQYDEVEIGATFFEAWDLKIDNAGEVFLASIDVHRFDNGAWTNLTAGTILQGYLDADLFFNSTGDLFVAGDLANIGRFDGSQWETLPHGLNGSQIRGFTEDANGDMYFQSQYDGIFKLENNAWTQQADPQAQAFDNVISYFHIDQQGRRWMNSNIHLSVNDNGTIQETLISNHTLEADGINSTHHGADGSMVFLTASDNNFSVLDTDGNWSLMALPAQLVSGEFLLDIQYFNSTDIWLGTSFGLYHYDGSQWDFNNLGFCRKFAVDSQGKMYITSDGKIYIIDGGSMTDYNPTNSPITNDPVVAQGVDANDNLWVASLDQTSIHMVSPSGTWTTFTQADHPALEKIAGDFHFDVNGNVWVPLGGGVVGVLKYDGTTFSNPYTGNIGQMENYNSYSIESDINGKMYFSHQYGVTSWEDGVWGDLLIEDVPQENSSHGAYIAFDNAGNLWWGSTRYGVFALPLGITNTQSADLEEKIDFAVFPNPVSNFAIIDFALDANANVNAAVFNNLGQQVINLDLGQLSSGNHQQNIDVAHLPKGIYTVQLRINDQSSARRIIVQ